MKPWTVDEMGSRRNTPLLMMLHSTWREGLIGRKQTARLLRGAHFSGAVDSRGRS